jgi:hypothetical protein
MRKMNLFVVLTLFLLAFMLFFAGCGQKNAETNNQQKPAGSTETQTGSAATGQASNDISSVDATGDATAVDQQISEVGTLDSDLNDDSMDDASQDLNDIKNW